MHKLPKLASDFLSISSINNQPSNLQRNMSNSTEQINTNVDPLLIANTEEITVKSAQNQEEPQENHKNSKENAKTKKIEENNQKKEDNEKNDAVQSTELSKFKKEEDEKQPEANQSTELANSKKKIKTSKKLRKMKKNSKILRIKI
ncbi:hypothetical protein PCASD_03183 [Puccinia coronata f. sp. avenae]|uniref:Uncharacterized protein n=1 Tax=Puccinia coronata f. sp. avenae TaxID=200324 RepID=A0A2N5VFD0_9BASI|nr:hypothetical protein PCASD_03183 [Puccinia coronata f. sp. avenae]